MKTEETAFGFKSRSGFLCQFQRRLNQTLEKPHTDFSSSQFTKTPSTLLDVYPFIPISKGTEGMTVSAEAEK